MRQTELPEGVPTALDDLLAEAGTRGVNLRVAAGKLWFSAPTGALTPDLRRRLGENKSELIRLLGGPSFQARGPVQYSPLPFHNADLLHYIRMGAIGPSFTNGTSCIVALVGPLDVTALTGAFQHLVRNHTILGTRIEDGPTGARLVFNQEVLIHIVDATGEPEPNQLNFANENAAALLFRAFDLEKETLFRPFVVKVSAQEHLVGFVIHHIVGDGVSVTLAAEYLWRSYSDMRTGSFSLPPAPAMQYSDYIAAVNDWLLSPALRYRRNYWEKHLSNSPSIALPTDFALKTEVAGNIEIEPFTVDPQLTASAIRLAGSLNCSLFTLLLSINASVLHLLAKADDIVVLAIHNGRDDPSVEYVIGSFQNPIPMRISISPMMSFRELVQQAHKTILTAYEKQIPYGYIAHHLQDEGVRIAFPEFNFLDMRSSAKSEPLELSVKPCSLPAPPADATTASHPFLATDLILDASRVHGFVRYFAPIYRRHTIKQFISSFCALAKQAITNPEIRISLFHIDQVREASDD
jgi:hypothetical protein